MVHNTQDDTLALSVSHRSAEAAHTVFQTYNQLHHRAHDVIT